MSRPPRAGAKATKRISVALTDREHALLVAAAGEAGVALSAYIRDAALALASRPPPTHERETA